MVKWSKQEVEDLTLGVSLGLPYYDIAYILNRTEKAIRIKASKLNIHTDRYNYWKDSDVRILIKNYEVLGAVGCKPLLELDRPLKSIHKKAAKLGLSKVCVWSLSDIEYLKCNYTDKGATYCSDFLGKSFHSVTRKAERLGLLSSKKGKGHSEKAYCYLVYFKDLNLYKVGITDNLNRRLKEFGVFAEVIEFKHFETRTDALLMESSILKTVCKNLVNTGALANGNYETFKGSKEELEEWRKLW